MSNTSFSKPMLTAWVRVEGGELIHKPFSSAKAGENSVHIEMTHSGPCNKDVIANVWSLGQAQASTGITL